MDRITVNPGGVPLIRGKISIPSVLLALKQSKDYNMVMELFPELELADIKAAEHYASQWGE